MKFEIVDLGVHRPDYFQGFGVSHTKFEHCTYGIGDTAQEAYDDALDSAAQFSPWAAIDLSAVPLCCPFSGAVPEERNTDSEITETAWYHVGIRWNT
jgi:hypothetical protein